MKNETIKIIRKMELTAFVIVLAIFTYLLKQSKKMTEEKRYKGEIIAERRRNLDFSLEFSKVCMGLTAGLPRYSRKDRISHYNKKISKIWESRR